VRDPVIVALPAAEGVSDAELVAACVAGDRFSREVLYRRHGRYLLGLATRLVGNRHEAEEIVQDTFVIGLTELGNLREPAAVRAWLAQIAVSLVSRRLRRGRLLRFFSLGLLGTGGVSERAGEGAEVMDVGRGLAALAAPDLSAEDRADLVLLDRALARLRPEVRVAWMLRHVEGHALAEVASACGCSLATAKRRIAEAERSVGRLAQLPGDER
jgi:RNA polymerase sigma-70 factor (ECF subfamily)